MFELQDAAVVFKGAPKASMFSTAKSFSLSLRERVGVMGNGRQKAGNHQILRRFTFARPEAT
jgi:hypothetical protein